MGKETHRLVQLVSWIASSRSWICVGSVCLLVALTLLILGCGASTPETPVRTETMSLRDLYPRALEVARAWKEDAFLVDAETPFWLDGADMYQVALFYFRSPSTNIIGLHVRYDPATDTFRDKWLSIHARDPERDPEIKDSEWCIDSTEALEIAQSHGGAEFLAGRSESDLSLSLELEKQQVNGQPLTVWFVKYYYWPRDARLYPWLNMANWEELFVVIDALSGKVVEVKGQE